MVWQYPPPTLIIRSRKKRSLHGKKSCHSRDGPVPAGRTQCRIGPGRDASHSPQLRARRVSLTGKKSADGTVKVQFDGCTDGKVPNCVPITPGWNYMVRLYRPHGEILNGAWKFPAAVPAS